MTARGPALRLLLAALLVGCGGSEPALSIRTSALASPEDTVSAFEPFVTLDPNAPDRIVVGAQYGMGYNRGGLRMWSWSTANDGKSWTGGARVMPKAFPTGQWLAADLTMAVGPDGTIYHLSLTTDSAPNALFTSAAALAASADGGQRFEPRLVFGKVEQIERGRMFFTDKSWITADAGAKSPGRGNLYFGWSRATVDFKDTSVTTAPMFAVSRDGGRTMEPPTALAGKGFGVTITVRTDGTVDVAWTELRPGGSEGYRVLHASSSDRGRTFGPPSVVAEARDTSESIELPQITAGPGNRLLVCWTQGRMVPGAAVAVWCSTRTAEGPWEPATAALDDPVNGRTFAYPAIAATGDAFWMLAYSADSLLETGLYRSDDGHLFTHAATLASEHLGAVPFCPRPGLPCRKANGVFFPGDYVSLAGSTRRLAAAYTMPRQPGAAGASTTMVSVVDVR